MKLIDRDALVAEIERLIDSHKPLKTLDPTYYEGLNDSLGDILSFLDSLETKDVKEVNLENEFFNWYNEEKNRDYNASILYEKYSTISKKLAKHFFELGLKSQKGK